MVRDAYSAGGRQPPEQADGGTALDIRGSAANLTQELAQLLAASIAQGQSGKRLPGAATGSELASLAALVSASQSQRTHQPSFKDGLSSLSYARPAQSPAPPTGGGGLLVSEQHDDEPMPIPSTWRQPMLSDDDRWYRQQLGAAALGLVAGLVVVVPAVLWLSGWLGGPQTKSTIKMADVKTVKVQPRPVEQPRQAEKTENASQYVAASVDPRLTVAPPPPVAEQVPVRVPAPKAVEPPRPRPEDLLAQAERRIRSGDITTARDILVANESVAPGLMLFALAETYDPNMLAAWSAPRGVSSDPLKAKALYTKALELGDNRARKRLDELR